MKTISLLLAAMLCLLRPAQSKPTGSQQAFLEQNLRDVLQIAESSKGAAPVELAKKTRPALEKVFDFSTLTKRAIGVGWRELNPQQQKQAIDLFSEILIRSYAARFGWETKIDMQFSPPIEIGNGRCEVPVRTTYAGGQTNVLYRLESAGDRWVVYDVIIEGVSMTANYRAQFDSIRQRGGAQGIITHMQELLKAS